MAKPRASLQAPGDQLIHDIVHACRYRLLIVFTKLIDSTKLTVSVDDTGVSVDDTGTSTCSADPSLSFGKLTPRLPQALAIN